MAVLVCGGKDAKPDEEEGAVQLYDEVLLCGQGEEVVWLWAEVGYGGGYSEDGEVVPREGCEGWLREEGTIELRGNGDVDGQGKVQWLYIWRPEVPCLFAWLLIIRKAPDNYTFMATLRLPVESQLGRPAGKKNPKIPAENNQ